MPQHVKLQDDTTKDSGKRNAGPQTNTKVTDSEADLGGWRGKGR